MAVFFEELLGLNAKGKFHLVKSTSRETKSRVLEDSCSIAYYDKHSFFSPIDLFYIESKFMRDFLVFSKEEEEIYNVNACLKDGIFTEKKYRDNFQEIRNNIYPKYRKFISECNKEMDRYFSFDIMSNIEIFDRNEQEYSFRIKGLEKISFSAVIKNRQLESLTSTVTHDLGSHLYYLNRSLNLERNKIILEEILK